MKPSHQHLTVFDLQYPSLSYPRFFAAMFSDDNASQGSESPASSISSLETPSTPLSPVSPGGYAKMLSKDFRQDSAVICGNSQPAVRRICCIGAGYVGKL
jgi:hypothetical protein